MNTKKLPQVDKALLWVSLGLLVFGLLSLYSASSVVSLKDHGNNYWYILRQLTQGAIPGLALMYFFSKLDYHLWQRLAPFIMLIGIALLIVVFLPGLGFSTGG